MPPGGSFNDLFIVLQSMMLSFAPIFEGQGLRFYRYITVILIAYSSIQAAYGNVSAGRFISLMFRIGLGLMMLKFYSAPLAIFGGRGFYHLIIDQGAWVANQLNGQMVTTVLDRLSQIYFSLESPGLSAIINFLELIRWTITITALILAYASVYFVISFGYVAVAVCVLIGPCLIPFFIFPEMEWVFWGWLKATLMYSWYGAVANAYMLVGGTVLIKFLDRAGAEDLMSGWLAVHLLPFISIMLAFVYGILKVPALTNSIFAGRSGESAGPGL